MRWPAAHYIGAMVVCFLFVLIFAVSLAVGNGLVETIAGEGSVGAWMSGTLLTMSATLCGVIAMRHPWNPWLFLAIFFLVLAIDENFMLHENMKREIVFSDLNPAKDPAYWLGELPVLIAATVGAGMAFLLWSKLNRKTRWMIPVAAFFGTVSVAIDVTAAGVLWEDSLKVVAELVVACALLIEVQRGQLHTS